MARPSLPHILPCPSLVAHRIPRVCIRNGDETSLPALSEPVWAMSERL